ncbi:MAG: DUF2515 family protein [Telluria sp.]
MADVVKEKGVSVEALGTCMTNTTAGSTHDAKVEYSHLWSYAQQAALIAVSEKNNLDGRYHLIADPERRAKRIAGHYAALYFDSAKKSNKQVQFYWPALAAFVVKDIVEAYRFAREDVLHREWKDLASVARNSVLADIGSIAMTNDSPYQHALRTYSALAKGNLWLFMDIYPWLWFFQEYGINPDGSLNKKRLEACLPERNWNTFQKESKEAIEELPFGPNWMSRLATRLDGDVVYKKAKGFFDLSPDWTNSGGYGRHTAAAFAAHQYCRSHAKDYDLGYRTPQSNYWPKFKQAYFVMESEHIELRRMTNDSNALNSLVKLRSFVLTSAVSKSYQHLISEHSAEETTRKVELQRRELVAIAEQEQLNVLQPLIYDDALLKDTMDVNHRFSRLTDGWLSPKFKVVYSADPTSVDPTLETVFDAPASLFERFSRPPKSLPNAQDRMNFVEKITTDFNRLMSQQRSYMDGELQKIARWISA